METTDIPADDNAQLRAFLDGALRDRIGLTDKELGIGHVIAANHMQRGAFQEAFRLYVALILCEPTNVDYQIGLARAAVELGHNLVASQAASLAVGLAPGNAQAWLVSARAYLGLGLVKEATDDLHEAIERGQAARDGALVEEARKLLAVAPGRAEASRDAVSA